MTTYTHTDRQTFQITGTGLTKERARPKMLGRNSDAGECPQLQHFLKAILILIVFIKLLHGNSLSVKNCETHCRGEELLPLSKWLL